VATPRPLACPVKYRKVLRDEVVPTIIQETAVEIAARFPIEMEAMGTDQNHIPLLCSAHPNVAPGRIVQIFKRITAWEIFRRKPAVKRVLWGGELHLLTYVKILPQNANKYRSISHAIWPILEPVQKEMILMASPMQQGQPLRASTKGTVQGSQS